jgi:hypothetical protein
LIVALREELAANERVWFIARREKALVSEEGPATGIADGVVRIALLRRKRAAFMVL